MLITSMLEEVDQLFGSEGIEHLRTRLEEGWPTQKFDIPPAHRFVGTAGEAAQEAR